MERFLIKVENFGGYYNGKIDEFEVVRMSEWIEKIALINEKLKNRLTELPENKKVYFDKSVMFPKRRFQRDFPTNKIVSKTIDADVIIVDGKRLAESFFLSKNNYVLLSNGNYGHPIQNHPKCIDRTEYEFSRYLGVEKEDRIESLQVDVDFFDVKDLQLKTTEKLTLEGFSKIDKMLASGSQEVCNLAFNLLTVYDYKEAKHLLAILIHKNYNKIRSMKKVNVEVKALFRKLSLDFPGYDYSGRNTHTFYFNMLTDYPNDPIIDEYFHDYMIANGILRPDKKIKIYEKTDQVQQNSPIESGEQEPEPEWASII